MISLTKRLKQENGGEVRNGGGASQGGSGGGRRSTRTSIRDKLLVREVQEVESHLPPTCKLRFEDPNTLHDFLLTICPQEGHWQGGNFTFHIKVPLDYNIAPPTVRCLTRLWHPNINEDGEICLSILRQNSVDGMGWAPTRRLRDIVWGLTSLFEDLLNFEDPLNSAAAEHYLADPDSFRCKVRDWIAKYAKRSNFVTNS